jgi:hypothetical protein
MFYTPSVEKLAALNFRPVAPVYSEEMRFVHYKEIADAPDLESFISIYPDQEIQLWEGGGWSTAAEPDIVFVGYCPNEGFFDLLLLAVGFPVPKSAPAYHAPKLTDANSILQPDGSRLYPIQKPRILEANARIIASRG